MEGFEEINWLWVAIKIIAVIFLVGLNGFFVAAEFALVKVRETQLQPLLDKGHRRAKVAKHVVSNLDAFLSALRNASRLLTTCLATFARRCPLSKSGWSWVSRTLTSANSAATKKPLRPTKNITAMILMATQSQLISSNPSIIFSERH